MKHYTEAEILEIEKEFRDLAHKQLQDQRRTFFTMLLIALGVLAAGFFIGMGFCK